MVSHFQPKNSKIVAPLTEIVTFFEKKIWGTFWRFSGQKRALPDSKHLANLNLFSKKSIATFRAIKVNFLPQHPEFRINIA